MSAQKDFRLGNSPLMGDPAPQDCLCKIQVLNWKDQKQTPLFVQIGSWGSNL